MEREGLKQIDLADLIDMEPQNFSRIMRSGKVSEKTCQKIVAAFPEYRVEWLLGYDDFMTKSDWKKDYIDRKDSANNAAIQLLDSALREVCLREEMEVPVLDNIPELLLLEAQLKDFADSLMWNYVKHRNHSHVWGLLDQF